MAGHDWRAWHKAYDNPDSTLPERLTVVQERIAAALDAAPAGPLRLISMCAGQGRDVIPVLAGHPRGRDVTARLVELDPQLAEVARQGAAAAGLGQVEVMTGDAGVTSAYTSLIPADIVLVCGVFGNISEADIERTIGCCAWLSAGGATVIWTRARGEPDLIPQICDWFAGHGFELLWLSGSEKKFGVGAHRFTGQSQPRGAAVRMFTFLR